MSPDDLVQIEEIKRLKYRYARLLDTKEWDALAELFVPGATAAYSGGQLSFSGRDEIIVFLRSALGSPDVITSHAMGQPEITLTGPDAARATWSLHDVVIAGDTEVRGASFYDDEYVRTPDGWRFTHTGYRRVYEEVVPRAPGSRLTATWWENEGRSSLVGGNRT